MADEEPGTPLDVFGTELRAQREHAGMTRAQLANEMIVSESLIAAIEHGRRMPRRSIAEIGDRLFGMPGTLMRLWRLATQRAYPVHFGVYADLESEAAQVHMWEMRYVPGLLQTECYARAMMNLAVPRAAPDEIEDGVKERMARRDAFMNGKARAWFVLDESVLYRPFGGERVMHGQMEHLIGLTGNPKITIQILPFMAIDHPGSYGPLIIFRFASAPAIGYAEGRGSGRMIETPADVDHAIDCYDHVRASALGPRASVEYIRAKGLKWI